MPNTIALVAGDPAGADLAWKHSCEPPGSTHALGCPTGRAVAATTPSIAVTAYLLTLIAAAAMAVWLLASRTVSVTVYVPALA